MKDIETLLKEIQEAAYEVHLHLCPGFLENVYQNALMHELSLRGIHAEKEVNIAISYKGSNIGDYRADIVVENCIILELKAVSETTKLHEAQLVNYLQATGIDNGVLINFGSDRFRFIRKNRLYNRN